MVIILLDVWGAFDFAAIWAPFVEWLRCIMGGFGVRGPGILWGLWLLSRDS